MCSQHSHKAVEVALPPHTRAPDLAAGMLHLPCIRNPFCDVMLCHTIYADALYYLAPHIYLYKLYILNTFNLRFCPFPSLSLSLLLSLSLSLSRPPPHLPCPSVGLPTRNISMCTPCRACPLLPHINDADADPRLCGGGTSCN